MVWYANFIIKIAVHSVVRQKTVSFRKKKKTQTKRRWIIIAGNLQLLLIYIESAFVSSSASQAEMLQ